MSKTTLITVPDIGDFSEVEVIEVLVKKGDSVNVEDSLITVESDKASMEIPSPVAGKIKALKIKVGDKVSLGSDILELEAGAAASGDANSAEQATEKQAQNTGVDTGSADIQTEVVVLGSGPGGYTAAFRAADLGKKVILVERYASIGGVCLNVGCIPSKALLHTADIINEAAEFAEIGVTFGKPKIDIDKIRAHKEKIIGRLTGGLAQLAKQRKITIVQGYGQFTSANTIEVTENGETKTIHFQNAIIAVGSSVTSLPFVPWEDPRVIDSTGALELSEVPKKMLVVGGGIIGLEMAMVYDSLGTEITIVELSSGLMPGADRDLVRVLEKKVKKRYASILTNTKVTTIKPMKKGLKCTFEDKQGSSEETYDMVLVAIGRKPNGKIIAAENAGVNVTEHGFINVDKQCRTNVEHIFAIGDVVGQPMLAHKAVHEGKVAAEVIAGEKSFFDARTIPSVAYTDPEIAWCGLTEEQAKQQGIEYKKGAFPWAASGRALSMGADNGITKVLFDKQTDRVIGAGIVGKNAGELISEAVLALEMGADAQDLGLTIHPHPTLSETICFAAEVAEGTITDLYIPKKK